MDAAGLIKECIDLFKDFTAERIKQLVDGSLIRSFEANEAIAHQGAEATHFGVATLIVDGNAPDILNRALFGEDVGTLILPKGGNDRLSAKRRTTGSTIWLLITCIPCISPLLCHGVDSFLAIDTQRAHGCPSCRDSRDRVPCSPTCILIPVPIAILSGVRSANVTDELLLGSFDTLVYLSIVGIPLPAFRAQTATRPGLKDRSASHSPSGDWPSDR